MGHVLRGRLHLRAQPSQEHLHGLRERLHLRPPPNEEQVQGLQGIRVGGFDRALAGVIGGLAIRDQPRLTVATQSPRVYLGSRE